MFYSGINKSRTVDTFDGRYITPDVQHIRFKPVTFAGNVPLPLESTAHSLA
jgi:hypothetical protein